jgi:hypothetical protein
MFRRLIRRLLGRDCNNPLCSNNPKWVGGPDRPLCARCREWWS